MYDAPSNQLELAALLDVAVSFWYYDRQEVPEEIMSRILTQAEINLQDKNACDDDHSLATEAATMMQNRYMEQLVGCGHYEVFWDEEGQHSFQIKTKPYSDLWKYIKEEDHDEGI
ncbi:MAG: hypothetical protein JSV32_00420 [Dehalococcoidia bacterium]|nr:MAG: hypothetical protein JSV32_00420 [Dehalococcoidia bacterium]